MNWFPVTRFALNEDLYALNQLLQMQGFTHRFTEEQGSQILWVFGEVPAQQLQLRFQQNPDWYREINVSETTLSAVADIAGMGSYADQQGRVIAVLISYPVTLLLILGGILGALLVAFDTHYQWLPWLTSQPFVVQGNQIGFYSMTTALKAGELWRLITPIFLHFGALHIIFNALWLWEFGRRTETALGTGYYLSVILMISIISNFFQYYWEGPSLFGGLSGVLYGLLGFIWMRSRFYPGSIVALTNGIIGFMLVWLVLCMSGLVNAFISGQVANAAHVAGLVGGMLIGLVPVRTQKTSL